MVEIEPAHTKTVKGESPVSKVKWGDLGHGITWDTEVVGIFL